MSFARPDVVALLPALLVLIAVSIVAQWRRARRLVDAFGGAAPASRLTGLHLERFPRARLACALLAAAALVLASAGIEPDQEEPPPPPRPIDLVVAVDVSHSMSGRDVTESRIERARAVVRGIVDEAVADRVALSLFADWPFGLVPLTHDAAVLDFFIPWVTTELVPVRDQGTGLASLVSHAAATWSARARPDALGVLLVVTDGEVHGANAAVLSAVTAVADSGLVVWTAGVGSAAGAPLFMADSDGAPLLDGSGQAVVASYDPSLLREVADLGGGAFYDVSDESGLRALIDGLRGVGGSVRAAGPTRLDPTSWLIFLALALLVAEAVLDRGGARRRQT